MIGSKRSLHFTMDDGVVLAADAWGDPARPVVILLHGGGQTRHAWKGTAEHLVTYGFCAIAVDLRGHGESGWSKNGEYSIDRFASDVRTLATSFATKPVIVGASLGGIASLIALGEHQRSMASALILVDITPRVDPEGVARIRAFMSAHLNEGFGSLEEAANAVAAYLPHRPRPKSVEGLRKNLRQDEDGRYRWHYDPAFVSGFESNSEGAREQRLMLAASHLTLPVLLIRGGASELVSEETARDFIACLPNASYVSVAGASHIVAGDLNDPFAREVVGFLDKLTLSQPFSSTASV